MDNKKTFIPFMPQIYVRNRINITIIKYGINVINVINKI